MGFIWLYACSALLLCTERLIIFINLQILISKGLPLPYTH